MHHTLYLSGFACLAHFFGCFNLCIFPSHVYVWYHLLLLHLDVSKCSLHYFVFRLFMFPAILLCPDLYSHHPVHFSSYLDSMLPFCLPLHTEYAGFLYQPPLPPPPSKDTLRNPPYWIVIVHRKSFNSLKLLQCSGWYTWFVFVFVFRLTIFIRAEWKILKLEFAKVWGRFWTTSQHWFQNSFRNHDRTISLVLN